MYWFYHTRLTVKSVSSVSSLTQDKINTIPYHLDLNKWRAETFTFSYNI